MSIDKATQNEITKQLKQLKQQLDRELLDDLKELRAGLLADLKQHISNEIKVNLKTVSENMRKETNNQLVVANDMQLVAVTNAAKMNKEIAGAICKQASEHAYNLVINEINTNVMPKVDNMMQWMSYQTQDTTELITDYRRAVHKQSSTNAGNLLTSGGTGSSSRIQPNVEMFFTEGD